MSPVLISNSRQTKLWQTHLAERSEGPCKHYLISHRFLSVFVRRREGGGGRKNNCFLWTREQIASRGTTQAQKAELTVQRESESKAGVSQSRWGEAGAGTRPSGSDWFVFEPTSLFPDVFRTPQMFGWNNWPQFGLAPVQLGLWTVPLKIQLNHMAPRISAAKTCLDYVSVADIKESNTSACLFFLLVIPWMHHSPTL